MGSRSKTVAIDGASLMKRWGPLMELRSPGWDWSGKDYTRPGRNQAADKTGLEKHEKPLALLLETCPNGYPSHTSLRSFFSLADEKHSILSGDPRGRWRSSSEASDIWRKMAKDIVVLSRGPRNELPPCLQALCGLVTGGVATAPLSATALRVSMEDFDVVEEDMIGIDDDSDNEVMLVSVTCKCSDCEACVLETAWRTTATAPVTATATATPPATATPTTVTPPVTAATATPATVTPPVTATLAIPDAKAGGQRLETLKGRRIRIKGKMSEKAVQKLAVKSKDKGKKNKGKKSKGKQGKAAMTVDKVIQQPCKLVERHTASKTKPREVFQINCVYPYVHSIFFVRSVVVWMGFTLGISTSVIW